MLQVVVVGPLRRYVDDERSLELEGWAGRPVRDLLEHLGIPSRLVTAVLVDGRLVRKGAPLPEAGLVKLVPVLGGG
ncbi:MAG: MoaD/ThiS family protein [Chloroflexia bacterium]|nr:MoaD/ThiS family protein [Chloroflexia bacterium]